MRAGEVNPLGALPALSVSARRALWWTGALAVGNAIAVVGQAWALATALAAIVTTGAAPGDIGRPLGMLAVAIGLRAVFGWALDAVSARASAGAKEELRAALLDAALRRGPEWIHRRGAAELTALATKGLDSLDAYFSNYLPAVVTAGVVPPLVGARILAADWISAVAIACTVPLIPLFAWLVGRFTEQRTARAADAAQRLSGHVLELVRALPVLVAFDRAREQAETVWRIGDSHRRATNATLRVAFLSALVLELLSSLSVALVAVGIGLRLVSGDLDLATGLFVLLLAPECYLPLRAAGAAHHASEDGLEAVRRVREVVTGSHREETGGGGAHGDPGGTLRVTDLRVARRGGYAPDGLSFTARPGEIIRLEGFDGIGPSGSGKSTTFAALLRFVEPDGGAITVGGTDIRAWEPGRWRRHLAWVPQRPVFTGGTVADELALALADQPEVPDPAACLAEVGAAHLLRRRIDELSTGQRQRVAVARALLRLRGRARVLLLDEPTAHLDAAAASQVHAAVRRAAEAGAIVVVASHRPESTSSGPAEARADEPAEPSAAEAPPGPLPGVLTRRGLLGVALGALSLLAGVALTATSAWLISRASQQPPVLTLTVAVVGVRTFALSRAVTRYLERLVTHDAAFLLVGELRVRLWNALVRLGPARTSALRRGGGRSRLVDDVDTVRDLVPRVVVPPLVAGFVAVAAIAAETAVLPPAGLLLAVALLVAGVAAPGAAVLAERRASAAVAHGRRRVAQRSFALLDGAAELLACGAHTARRAEIAAEDATAAARARRAAFGSGLAGAVLTLVLGTAVFGGTWLAAAAVAGGRLPPEWAPVVGLTPLAVAEAIAPLPGAAQRWRPLREARTRLARVTSAKAPGQPGPNEETHGEVVLSGVRARWPGAREPALEGTVRIPSGAHVAVVGPSGAGKSTLCALLLGLLTAEDGTVSRPRRVSWCPQEPSLVSTTVRENLRLAAPSATDQRLADALRLAGLPEWTTRLDEPVRSGGAALSGGQAQRLALARAVLVEDADLVVLDEPTAHLDVATAEELLPRLHAALRGRTVVHVTHRQEELRHADLVLRVEGGAVTGLSPTAHLELPVGG